MRMKTRRILTVLSVLTVIAPMIGCNAQDHSKRSSVKHVVLNVVLFNYLDRPIFDVDLNGTDIGVAGKFGGGRGVMTGVTIPMGTQTLSWRLDGPEGTPRNGETINVKNSILLTTEKIPSGTCYLGVHIYPDETAEFTFSQYLPKPSERGEAIYKEHHLYGR